MGASTHQYRYSIERNGHVCCRTNEYNLLCAECRAKVDTCTCEKCKSERASRITHASGSTFTPHKAIAAILTAYGVEAPQPALEATGVPKPPDQVAAIRAARGVSVVASTATNAAARETAVPPPPDQVQAVLAARNGGQR